MKRDLTAKDPAFPVMAMDVMENVLSRADNPGNMGEYVTEELRELTGARCALVIQCLGEGGGSSHRVVSVNPVRMTDWAGSAEANRLYEITHQLSDLHFWRGDEPTEAAGFLMREGFELSMAIPLNAGETRVGTMILLGLPDEEHISSLRNLLNPLSAIIALALSNAFLFTHQEEIIGERTEELSRANRKLQEELAQRRLAEEALSREKALLRCLIDSASDLIFIKDCNGFYRGCNRASEGFVGLSESEQIGKTDFDFFGREMAEEIRRIDKEVLAEGKPRRIQDWVPDVAGAIRYLDTLKAPYFGPDGEVLGLVGIARDNTDLKRTEEEIKRAREAAEAASRVKGEFLASMSHEIKTPINGIIGMAQLLRLTDISREQRELLDGIDISSERLIRLVNDILDLSKIEAGKVDLEETEFSLRRCINDAVLLHITQIRRKKLKINTDISRAVPEMVAGDEGRFNQIIQNLMDNAVKFTDRGSITITAGVIHQDAETGVIGLSVADTGIGMSGETMAKIFTPFSQADASTTRRFGGTGLGLAICRKLADLLGGHIWAESNVGEGSVFHLVIPFKFPRHREREIGTASISPGPKWEGSPLSVLVAEDDVINRTFVEALLRKMGHSVVCVSDGEEAMEKWRAERFDCILMDVRMPGVDGVQATERIRMEEKGTGAHIPIIACTASPVRGETNRILEAGFDAYLCKPLRWENLFSAFLCVSDTVSQREIIGMPSGNAKAAKPLTGWPETLPGMDLANALERVDGDGQLYIHLLKNFVENHEKDLREIREAVFSGESRKVSFILHNLKGISGLLSLTGIEDISLKLERELASGASGKTERLLDDLDGFFVQAAKNLEKLYSLGKTAPVTGKEVMEEERTDIPGIIAELEALVERGSIDSRRQLALLRKALPDDRFSDELDRIKSYLDKFDFKGAKDPIRRLVSRIEESG